MVCAGSLASARTAVKLLPLLLVVAAAAQEPPERLLLLRQAGQVPGWTTAPVLTELVYAPDLFSGTECHTLADGARYLRDTLDRDPTPPAWLRLDTLDVSQISECRTCAPPSFDPARLDDIRPAELTPRRLAFYQQAVAALAGSPCRPYVVAPAGATAPAAGEVPAGLWVLLAGPPLPVALSADGLARRRSQWEQWRRLTPRVYNVVSDGSGEMAGLPLDAGLLLAQATTLPRPALVARDAAQVTWTAPEALRARLRQVLVAGARDGAGDWFRTDDPDTARLLDVYAPLTDQLGTGPGAALTGTTLAALRAVREWDETRSAGRALDSAALVALLDRRRSQRGAWESRGPLSAAFRRFVATPPQLVELLLPRPPQVAIDAQVGPSEWRGAATLQLAAGDDGLPNERPATVTLAADDRGLWLSVVATEPNPEDASLNDALVLTFGDLASGCCTEVRLAVSGKAERRRVERLGAPAGPYEPFRPTALEATFDGPGWVLEACLPWAALGPAQAREWRLNVATEHRSGRQVSATLWLPTGGARHLPARFARCRRLD